jgi:hypothetical protein
MAALPLKAFSGKVESGSPPENATKSTQHFQEKHARANARVESGFPPENATQSMKHFQEKPPSRTRWRNPVGGLYSRRPAQRNAATATFPIAA